MRAHRRRSTRPLWDGLSANAIVREGRGFAGCGSVQPDAWKRRDCPTFVGAEAWVLSRSALVLVQLRNEMGDDAVPAPAAKEPPQGVGNGLLLLPPPAAVRWCRRLPHQPDR